ncbi:hypothetical protein AGMMS50293_25770 [Spirochaetia bacterium]|nr:hypothetical protein AGMMS50293_25770 [Spirochaetia bacterium]
MNGKMKLFGLIVSICILFAGCMNIFDPDISSNKSNTGKTEGLVRIYIDNGEAESARTLQPQIDALAGYRFSFVNGSQVSHDPVDITAGNSIDVYLADGVHTITVKAYKGGGTIGDAADEIAGGSISVELSGGVVISNGGIVPSIILGPSGTGNGTLRYEIINNYVAGYIKLWQENGTTAVTGFGSGGTLAIEGTTAALSGDFSIPRGRYIGEIKLTNNSGLTAHRRETIEIWPETVTLFAFEPSSYTDPSLALANKGASLSANSTIGGIEIGVGQGTGADESNAITYVLGVKESTNVTALFNLELASLFANISWAVNNGGAAPATAYNALPVTVTDFSSANNCLWVKVVSEDASTTKYYKFTLYPESPGQGFFKDTNTSANQLAGMLTWTKPANTAQILGYRIYFGSDSKTKLNGTVLATIDNPGTESWTLTSSPTSLPTGATHFLIYSIGSPGEYPNCLAIPIADAKFNNTYGAFTVTGTDNTGISWTSPTLAITKPGTYYITGTGEPTTDRLITQPGNTQKVDITLENVNIDVSGSADICAFEIGDGTVNLTLKGTNILKSGANRAGLLVQSYMRLFITKESTGSLKATGGTNGSGIGGGRSSSGANSVNNSGGIDIKGGVIVAQGGQLGAGIGGGYRGHGGVSMYPILISGGTVTATGGDYAAGIGGGSSGDGGTSGRVIGISGGVVTATGGQYGAGIGGGNSRPGFIEISGGTVAVTGGAYGAGIGGGGNNSAGGTITITGGFINATGGYYSASASGSGIGNGSFTLNASGNAIVFATSVQPELIGGKNVNNAFILAGNAGISYGDLTLSQDVTIPAETKFKVMGGVLTIPDNKTLTNNGTIYVYSGGSIDGIVTGNQPVSPGLSVTGTGPYIHDTDVLRITGNGTYTITMDDSIPVLDTDRIIVEPGVHANITLNGVKIDLGSKAGVSAFNMEGATVNLTLAGDNVLKSGSGKAGIELPAGSTLSISGDAVSTLEAAGGANAAGIGTLNTGKAGTISGLSGGVQVYTSSFPYDLVLKSSDTSGIFFMGNDGIVYGQVTLGQDLTIPAGKTLSIPPGSSLTIPVDKILTNNGIIIVNTGGELIGNVTGNQSVVPDLAISGDDTYTYVSNVLNIKGNGTYVIGMRSGVTETVTDRIVVSPGVTADITLSNVKIDGSATSNFCAFDLTGATVNLTLQGANVLKSGSNMAAVRAPTGAEIYISGSGSLQAVSGTGGSGIGGSSSQSGGVITIAGGTISAKGAGNGGAGIGGGSYGNGGTITISGGNVTASSEEEEYGGAGIGGGYGDGGNITISGGIINATGARYSAGVGGGGPQNGAGTIAITGGVINASGGASGIGGGSQNLGSGTISTIKFRAIVFASSITIPLPTGENLGEALVFSGNDGRAYNNFVLPGSLEIPAGKTLTITGGDTLIIPVSYTLTNNGAIYVDNGSEIQGTVTGNQPIYPSFVVSGTAPYSYQDKLLTITGNGSATISLRNGETVSAYDSIKVKEGVTADITISNLNITKTDSIDISSAVVNLTVVGINTITRLQTNAGTLSILNGGQGLLNVAYIAGNSTITNISGSAIVIAETIASGVTISADAESGLVFKGNTGTIYGAVTFDQNLTFTSGKVLTIRDGTDLTIPAGITLTNNGTIYLDDGGTITVNGTLAGNNYITPDLTISGGASYTYVSRILTITGDGTYTISMRGEKTVSNLDRIVVSAGVTANITLNNVKIDLSSKDYYCAFSMSGATVNLTLNGVNELKSGINAAGIQVPNDGAVLVITAASTGSLEAIAIYCGAGIGGGYNQAGGTVTIAGGTVKAIGGTASAGIGGGQNGAGCTVTITGGIITVAGDTSGIGPAATGAAGTITEISNAILFVGRGIRPVIADLVTNSLIINNNFTVSTYGVYTLTQDITIPVDYYLAPDSRFTFTIAAGVTVSTEINGNIFGHIRVNSDGTMINNGTILNAGQIHINNGATTLTNNGTINNSGYIFNSATLTNNGTLINSGTIEGTVTGTQPVAP